MSQTMIPADLVRKVRDDLSAQFDELLKRLASGEAVSPGAVIDLAWLLKRMPETRLFRERLIELAQEGQDPETGLIIDRPEWESWPKPIAEKTSVLRVLGGTLKHRVQKLDRLADAHALLAWVKSRNWDHPWGGATGAGHMVVGVLFAMSDLGMLTQHALDTVFDYLDTLRDETFGVWTRGRFDRERPGYGQLGGAFYFGMLYDRFKRPLDRPKAVCRMLVDMQNRYPEHGSFCVQPDRSWPFGSYDHDTLYVLTRYSRQNPELRRQVLPAIERYARYFVEQMRHNETYTTAYPIPKVLAILRPIFPDPDDDVPYWDYQMYKWVL